MPIFRSRVMGSRHKNESTLRDTQLISEKVEDIKKQMKHYDEQICAKLNEIHKIDSLGSNHEEVRLLDNVFRVFMLFQGTCTCTYMYGT